MKIIVQISMLKWNYFTESPHSGPDEDHENWSDVSTVELGTFSDTL